MHAKLTLRIDALLIKAAKKYSKTQGKSLSQFISDYLVLLVNTHPELLKNQLEAIPPITQSLKGMLRDKKVSEDDYKKYLAGKFR